MSKKSRISIGWSKRDVTPSGPTMLLGQMGNRLATEVLDPLSVTVLALESENGGQSIMISLDTAIFEDYLLAACRERIAQKDPSIEPDKVFGSVTHTHTAPQYGPIVPVAQWLYPRCTTARGNCGINVDEMREKYPDFVDSEQYFELLVKNISDAVVEAWQSRKNGFVAWGYGTAAVGECRRLCFRDRGTTMYGKCWEDDFWNVEGHVDHSVNMLFTYDGNKKLSGMLLNLACPSQASEAESVVTADFWHDVRVEVAKSYGENIFILPQCSAAGDQSPHKLVDMKAETRMLKLKGFLHEDVESWDWSDRAHNQAYNLARRKEIACRIIRAVEDVEPYAAKDMRQNLQFSHLVETVELETRKITESESRAAAAAADKIEARLKAEGRAYNGSIPWNRAVVERYKNPQKSIPVQVHIIRLGDIAFASNRFEYYLDFGDRIKGRSAAEQTFIIQLAGNGTYLSCDRNNAGGSYGSVPASCLVSAAGGQQLVEATLAGIKKLFG